MSRPGCKKEERVLWSYAQLLFEGFGFGMLSMIPARWDSRVLLRGLPAESGKTHFKTLKQWVAACERSLPPHGMPPFVAIELWD